MSEKRILLASLLKPVNDTRMYEKLGLSLCRLDNVQVHVAGFSARLPQAVPHNLTFHPIFNFQRLSLDRAKAQRYYWKLLLQVKPDLIIVCTHELLLVSSLYKKLHKCILIYDVQENYSLNLLAQNNYAQGIKQVLAGSVRLMESFMAGAVDHFFLAERSYVKELSFLNGRYTVLENKFKLAQTTTYPVVPVQLNPNRIKLLYTGTIATLYGIFEAIELADQFYHHHDGVSLTIMGYCANKETLAKLQEAIAGKPYIQLIGGDKLVPHEQIIIEIQRSDLGLMAYHYNDSTFHCIPTKLYEYVALGLPILIQENPSWDTLIKTYDAGVSIDFKNIAISKLIPDLLNNTFYQKGTPDDVFWSSEEKKLISILQQKLGNQNLN